MLVDKERKVNNVKSDKSVFAIGDYRHNLPYKPQSDYHMSKVDQNPKQFLGWNSDTNFKPKIKRTVHFKKDYSKQNYERQYS